jgi:hypothetical protein
VPVAAAAPVAAPPERRLWPYAFIGAAAGLAVGSFLWLRTPTVTSAPPPRVPAVESAVSPTAPPLAPAKPPVREVAPPTPVPTPRAPVATPSPPEPPRPVAKRPPRRPPKPAAKPKPATAQRDPNLPFLPSE